MKIVKSRRFSVFMLAAFILAISTAVLIISVNAAMGAEEDRTITESALNAAPKNAAPANPTTYEPETTAEPAPTETTEGRTEAMTISPPPSSVDSPKETMIPTPTPEPVLSPSPEPTQTPVTEDQAIEACLKVATDIFGLDVDKAGLTVTLHPKEDIKDENGNIVNTTHEIWSVENADFGCGIDPATGTVISFSLHSDTYPGGSIKEGDFSRAFDSDIRDNGENIYIKAARELVNAKLAEGRKIEDIQIDGIQFVWDDNSAGLDPDATGTVQVDCHVYMETGTNYTLSYWGTDEVVLKIYSAHPTKHACTWGYFYEDEACNYPPEGSDWRDMSGITEREYSNDPPSPRTTAVPAS